MLFSKVGFSVRAVMSGNTDEEDRCLGVSEINLYGTPLHALMDSGAYTDFIPPKVIRELGSTPEVCSSSEKRKWVEEGVLGELKDASVTFGDGQDGLHGLGKPSITRCDKASEDS